ncbi:Uroporphyrinogen-III synthase [Massilia sp. Bi118]|uniref:uroporphyrinogen-III synthase n=1 Tax=Massilia sp. Bi118 TaxID=2822346 RepID=UPI001DAACD84|nr:uroporphyrinogen-III synthase [Massilia sp. Bi118]CAH0259264.1 Uroporphyrinogen-III synthase [Massilia sp. Bi118]
MTGAVVITRPRQQAEPLARAVAALGRETVLLPLLEISPLADDAHLRRVLGDLASYALVAFVSPNAIDAAFAHIDAWPGGVDIAVVGEGSRAALAKHGVKSEVRIHCPKDPAFSDSEHLLQALDLALLAGRRVLVVRGEGGRELLPDALRRAGATVETVASYRRAVPAPSPDLAARLRGLLAGPNDWIITSSEALRGLVSLVDGLASSELTTQLRQQRLIVPHARIHETALALGFGRLVLTGSGDERLLAALQSQA